MGIADSVALSNLELTRLFLAIVLLFFSAHWFGYVFNRVRLPRVIGEILGGILLGPSLLGYFSPSSYTFVFDAFEAEGKIISAFSWFGLILLMFVSGFEMEKSFSREDRKLVVVFLAGATVTPFVAGFFSSEALGFSSHSGPFSNPLSLSLILGVAVAVTSIPVISRIFMDLNIMQTRFAKIVIAIATIEDIALWAVLAVATGIAGPGPQALTTVLSTIAITGLFFAIGLLALPRLTKTIIQSRVGFLVRSSPPIYALFICLSLVAAASILGLNVVFGAFLAGIIVGMTPEIFQNAKRHIKSISLSLFIPLYFAVVGLRLDLVRQFDLFLLLGFLLFSGVLKVGGTLAVGVLSRMSWKSNLNFAIALNARGGPGIVLATIAFDLGIIDEPFFVSLVLAAVFTSLLAGYWFKYVLGRRWELLQTKQRGEGENPGPPLATSKKPLQGNVP